MTETFEVPTLLPALPEIVLVVGAMLLLMVFRHPVQPKLTHENAGSTFSSWTASGLLLATAILGLLWNLGALSTYGLQGLGVTESSSFLSAVSYTALGFLPAVVVHSVLKGNERNEDRGVGRWITFAAYSLGAIAGALHFYSSLVFRDSPSLAGLRVLTVGYLILIVALFVTSRGQQGWQRAVGATALAVFAVIFREEKLLAGIAAVLGTGLTALNGRLTIAGQDAESLARANGTPLFVYDRRRFAENARK